MLNSTIYCKAATFFSRKKQERLVSKLEKEFYKTILAQQEASNTLENPSLHMKKVSTAIHYSISHYHFEEDLLEYLLNLDDFVLKYAEGINKEHAQGLATFY